MLRKEAQLLRKGAKSEKKNHKMKGIQENFEECYMNAKKYKLSTFKRQVKVKGNKIHIKSRGAKKVFN